MSDTKVVWHKTLKQSIVVAADDDLSQWPEYEEEMGEHHSTYSEEEIATIILKAVNLKSLTKTKIKVHNKMSNLLNYITDGF